MRNCVQKMGKRVNVVKALTESQIGLIRSPYRQSLQIMHSLIRNKSTRFEKIWSETSKQPIVYDESRIYLNNYTQCLALCGKDGLPSNQYRLQKNTKIKRFEDIFIHSGPVKCTPLPRDDYKPYFLAVTSDNWLIRYDNVSGKKSTRFEKIWSETSKQPIVYDESRIYLNNYTQCLALCGKDGLPSNQYRLQKNTKIKRFEDIFIHSGPVKCTPLPRDDYKPYFLAVTSDNWLIRYDNVSGKVLQEIYLGYVQRYSFRNVDWESQGETIVLQSTLFPAVNNSSPNPKKLRVVQAMAIFKIMPIRFVGLFEVDQTTFGKEVNSANISEGLLIVGIGSQKNAKIRIYSLHEILNQTNRLFEATLDKKCPELGGKTGQYPFGLPLNYKIKTAPPVLFEVKCSEQNLHFGGHPWHYVTNPSNSSGVFEVRNVATNELAENGRFDVPNNTTFADTLTFHTDDTGRLVYESGNYIKFYKIFSEKCLSSIRQQFELKVRSNDKNGVTNGTETTTRVNGRREATKNRQIVATDFENELEMYLYLGINTQSNKNNNGVMTICDNKTGDILHEFSLGLTLNENSDYTLVMDLDTIIITCKEILTNKFYCYIFRMTRDSDIDLLKVNGKDCDDKPDNEKTTPKKRRKKVRKYY
ncbi:unnamed protein product [Medioppia subpectinata]|uniref:Uncharacterized protein n=1 Tax=Medioppia subpectinata TaxID=1979941 RepID=A0A7R9L1Z0_9ACAR|nr:unnamed protein product [Medioppia subpectinata]CAG2114012.1 unnamed protein product [Medioppia subpectinata]